jgi:hypothetical protein
MHLHWLLLLRQLSLVIGCLTMLIGCGTTATTATPNVAATQTRQVELAILATAQAPTATQQATATITIPPPTATSAPMATATTAPPTPTKVRPTATTPPKVTATPVSATAPGVGGTATGQEYTVTLYQLLDPAPAGQYLQPKAGMRWVAVDIEITNTGGTPLDYNMFFCKLKTTDHREYNATVGAADPPLHSGKQQPGEATRGWVTFEIPADSQLATLSTPFHE